VKKLIIFLSALLCIAAGFQFDAPTSQTGAAAFTCIGDGYLACDNFDDASSHACGDDANNNCYLTWSGSGTGTINNQATGLEGAYGKAIASSSGGTKVTTISFTGGTPRYVFFRWKPTTFTLSISSRLFAYIASSGGVSLNALTHVVGGTWSMQCLAGTPVTSATPAIVQNHEYSIWMDFTHTSPSVCNVYIVDRSVTVVKPGSPTLTTTDAGTSYDAAKLYFQAWGSGTSGYNSGILDRVRVGATDPGSGE
jgi:hypothetical protein